MSVAALNGSAVVVPSNKISAEESAKRVVDMLIHQATHDGKAVLPIRFGGMLYKMSAWEPRQYVSGECKLADATLALKQAGFSTRVAGWLWWRELHVTPRKDC